MKKNQKKWISFIYDKKIITSQNLIQNKNLFEINEGSKQKSYLPHHCKIKKRAKKSVTENDLNLFREKFSEF